MVDKKPTTEIHVVSTGARCGNDHMVTAFADKGDAESFADKFPDCYVDSVLVNDPYYDSFQYIDGYTCTINVGKNTTVKGDEGRYIINSPEKITKDGGLIQLYLTIPKPQFFDDGIVVDKSRLDWATITAVSSISNAHAKKAVQDARKRFLKLGNKWHNCHRIDYRVEL